VNVNVVDTVLALHEFSLMEVRWSMLSGKTLARVSDLCVMALATPSLAHLSGFTLPSWLPLFH
jgi:hypothetical protein